VFKRDNYTCVYCGRKPPEVKLEVDHVLPKSKGGSDDIDNLATSCFDCNHGKRDKLIFGTPQKQPQRQSWKTREELEVERQKELLEKQRQSQAWETDEEFWARRKRIESVPEADLHKVVSRGAHFNTRTNRWE